MRIKLVAVYSETGEVAEYEASSVIPVTITYSTPGQLTGDIRGHKVSIVSDGNGHFKTLIDGKEYPSLHTDIVEQQLGLKINRKSSGTQTGYPSETLGLTVWRHLTKRYNLLDGSIQYREIPN